MPRTRHGGTCCVTSAAGSALGCSYTWGSQAWLAEWGCGVQHSPRFTRQSDSPFCMRSFYWGGWVSNGIHLYQYVVKMHKHSYKHKQRELAPPATSLSCFHCLGNISRWISLTLSCCPDARPRSRFLLQTRTKAWGYEHRLDQPPGL